MAVAQGTYQATIGGNSDTKNATLPSGYAEGDLIVFYVLNSLGDASITGGTLILSGHQYSRLSIVYKILTATDVSNGYVTVIRGSSHPATWSVLAVKYTGFDTVNPIGVETSDAYTTSNVSSYTTTGVTPDYANSLVVVGGYQFGSDQNPTTGSIAVSDPTLTTGANLKDGTTNQGLATYIGVRPETTNTGTATAGFGGSDEMCAFIFTINPPITRTTGFKKAEVQTGQVSGTQTSYPAYVDLSRLGITNMFEAKSVRVYSDESKTTELAREIVSETEMHVKIPSITDGTTIYVDWDGLRSDYGVTDTYGRNNVWTGYAAVYHLNDVTDSSGNGRDLTAYGAPTFDAGQVGKAVNFSTSAGKNLHRTGDSYGILHNANLTMTIWANFSVVPTSEYHILSRAAESGGRYGWYLIHRDASNFYWRRMNSTASTNAISETIATTVDTWYKLTETYNGSTIVGYRDGVNKGASASSGDYPASGNSLAIGAFFSVTDDGTFKGLADEARLSNDVKSDAWELSEYNNQKNESAFWGTWSDVGESGGDTQPALFFGQLI